MNKRNEKYSKKKRVGKRIDIRTTCFIEIISLFYDPHRRQLLESTN